MFRETKAVVFPQCLDIEHHAICVVPRGEALRETAICAPKMGAEPVGDAAGLY